YEPCLKYENGDMPRDGTAANFTPFAPAPSRPRHPLAFASAWDSIGSSLNISHRGGQNDEHPSRVLLRRVGPTGPASPSAAWRRRNRRLRDRRRLHRAVHGTVPCRARLSGG